MSVVDIVRFAEKAKAELSEASLAIKIELFTSVVADTRVDTGRMRGGWQITTDAPTYEDIQRVDPNGSEVNEDIFKGVTPDGVDYLSNNVPYAPIWEEQDGMIARNMVRINSIIKGAIK